MNHVDNLIDAVLLAHNTNNLASAYIDGMDYIWKKVVICNIPYGRTMFTEEHMQKLEPLLQKPGTLHDKCWQNLKILIVKPGPLNFTENFARRSKE
jgi:hypothetical protein